MQFSEVTSIHVTNAKLSMNYFLKRSHRNVLLAKKKTDRNVTPYLTNKQLKSVPCRLNKRHTDIVLKAYDLLV